MASSPSQKCLFDFTICATLLSMQSAHALTAYLCPEYIGLTPAAVPGFSTTSFRANFSSIDYSAGGRVFCKYLPVNASQLFYTSTNRSANCPFYNGGFTNATTTSMSSSPTNMSASPATNSFDYDTKVVSSTNPKCHYTSVWGDVHGVMSNSSHSSCTVSGRGAICN